MKYLDITKKYDLSQLNDEELKKIWKHLVLTDSDWHNCDINEVITNKEKYNISFNSRNWEWDRSIKLEEATNAKELFYTDVYETAHNLIEKGKQQGLKIVVTFEKL